MRAYVTIPKPRGGGAQASCSIGRAWCRVQREGEGEAHTVCSGCTLYMHTNITRLVVDRCLPLCETVTCTLTLTLAKDIAVPRLTQLLDEQRRV